jgi:hypothetical protein
MSLLDTASLVVTPNGTKAGKLYSVVPSSGAGDLDVTRATTATRVNSSGLIESVASNVPRLDYTNGSCPSILVEPQRTNLALYSQQFTNASWFLKSGTFTDNYGVSPDGTTNATRFVSTDSDPYIYQSILGDGGTYTVSCYVKGVGSSIGKNGSIRVSANSQSFVITNQWQRVTLSCTITGILIMGLEIPDGASVGDEVLIWGYQCEKGSYATSYIPTTSASVTRNADVISKTGISSLIGQTEGTVFFDIRLDTISAQTNDPVLLYMKDGGTGERYVELFDNGNLSYIEFNGDVIANITKSGLTVGRHKCAIAYANNDMTFYVDGVQIGTDTSGTPAGYSTFGLQYYNTEFYGQQKVNTIALWKTRLTNTQLAQLTTI